MNAHTELVHACEQLLSVAGVKYWQKNLGILGQRRGLPDLIASVPTKIKGHSRPMGLFLAIECKTGEAKLSKPQKLWKEAVLDSAGIYLECRKIDQLAELLSRLMNRRFELT